MNVEILIFTVDTWWCKDDVPQRRYPPDGWESMESFALRLWKRLIVLVRCLKNGKNGNNSNILFASYGVWYFFDGERTLLFDFQLSLKLHLLARKSLPRLSSLTLVVSINIGFKINETILEVMSTQINWNNSLGKKLYKNCLTVIMLKYVYAERKKPYDNCTCP